MSAEIPLAAPQDIRHVAWLRSAVALALFFGLAHCPRVWTNDRTYPLAPITDALSPLPVDLNHLWFDALLASTLALALWPRTALVWIVVLLSGLLSLWDQARWQPWFYQYWWMLIALGGGRTTARTGLNLCLLILAMTYLWSGLQKCNPGFFGTVYPWFIQPLQPKLPAAMQNLLEGSAWTVPLGEFLLGIGLLCRPVQWLALLGAMAMHLFILWCLGPWGHNWNTVVWPWNIAMIGFCLILLGHAGKAPAGELLRPQSWRHGVMLFLFGLMPLFSFFGWWDKYFSAALYSGNTPLAWVRISSEAAEQLPAEVRSRLNPVQPGVLEVDLFTWSIAEMNVPPNPAFRLYRAAAVGIRRLAGPHGTVELVILLGTHPETGERVYLHEPVPPGK